jgi:hypothetical protein
MNRLLLAILLIPLMPACARFKPTQLKQHHTIETTATYASPLVDVSARHVQDTDLSPTARDITAQLIFIALSVKNKSDGPLYIDPTTITPHIMHRRDIAPFIPKSYGCYFMPAAVLGVGGFFFLWKIGLPLAGLFTFFGINQSLGAAKRTQASIDRHLLDATHTQVVQPHTTSTFLVAIDENAYKPNFEIVVRSTAGPQTCTLTFCKSMQTSYALS